MTEPNELYAWIREGEDSFCASLAPDGRSWLPLVAAKRKNAVNMKPLAQQVSVACGKPIRLVRFALVSVEDEIRPNGRKPP